MSKTPFFIKIARPTYGRYLKWRYSLEPSGFELLPPLNAPFLLLSNHAHVLDPFFISSIFPCHIRWVAGAYLFKNRLLNLLLGKWVGGIAKQQGRSDFQTIKDISGAFAQGDVVGLFPEGTRTWDGEPFGFDQSTAKLVRLFRVPVVLINLEGAYAKKPRWAKKSRSGNIIIRVVKTLYPQEISTMKLADIVAVLHKHLGFSHRMWPLRTTTPYYSKQIAEYAEQLLYLCPFCEGKSTLLSRGNKIYCTACSEYHLLDAYDTLQSSIPHKGFSAIHVWHEWERRALCTMSQHTDSKTPLFPEDSGVLLQKGSSNSLKTLSKHFTVVLKPTMIEVVSPEHSFQFDFARMQSIIVNAKSTMEFFWDNQLWRIRVDEHTSIVKYVEYFTHCIQEMKQLVNKEELV